MLDDVHDRHPRPMLARSHWLDLCGSWKFAYDDDDVGRAAHWPEREDVFDRTITVPFPPESPASGVNDPGFHPVVWYRRAIQVSPLPPGRRAVLHFGAVDYEADVWINGRHAGSHEGGQTPFRLDVTDLLNDAGQQVIVVRAFDDPHDLEQPRGKQDWQERPHVIWYERTTGIWQPVWLEVVPDTHVEHLRWTPSDTLDSVDLDLRIARPEAGRTRVTVQITTPDGYVLVDDSFTVGSSVARRRLAVDDARLDAERHPVEWSPEQPTLCEATITVAPAEGQPAVHAPDIVSSYIGFRTVGADDRRFLLNGRPYYLRFALAQGYWPESHLAAPSGEALRAEVELIKQLGFNGVRTHQKAEDPRFLYWCDRLGVLVLADAPAAFTFSERSLSRTVDEWVGIVKRDASHPCVIGWVAFNESWGVPQVARSAVQRDAVLTLYHLLKAVDPSRLVVANDGWEYVAGDFLGIHDYTHDPALIEQRYGDLTAARSTVAHGRPGGRELTVNGEHPAVPVLLSEFGGFTHASDVSGAWAGYGSVDSSDELVDRLTALFGVVHRAGGLAGFCFTQLSDTAQERNGLVTAERKPKADPEVIAQLVRGSSR